MFRLLIMASEALRRYRNARIKRYTQYMIINVIIDRAQPITICKVPSKNLMISLDNDSVIRVWNVFAETCNIEIKDHLLKNGSNLNPITIYYWEYLCVFVAVFS